MSCDGYYAQPQQQKIHLNTTLQMPSWFINKEQRGVSQLPNAVSAATTGNAGRPTFMMQISPGLRQPASPAQSGGMTGLPSQQGDMKRGAVEFNPTMSYMNKIKVSNSRNGVDRGHLVTFHSSLYFSTDTCQRLAGQTRLLPLKEFQIFSVIVSH